MNNDVLLKSIDKRTRQRAAAQSRVAALGPGYPKEFCFGVIHGSAMRTAVAKITPEIWSLSEKQLLRLIDVTPIRDRIKERFWQFASRAFYAGQCYSTFDLCKGICSYTNLYNHFLKHPEVVAWMLKCELPGIEMQMDYLQLHTLDAIFEVLSEPIHNEKNELDYRRVKLLLHILKAMAPTLDWYAARERYREGRFTPSELEHLGDIAPET